ncbi:MAG: PDZ domain-containing protein [Pseudomonadota bacterium]
MKTIKFLIPVVALLLGSGQAAAQSGDERVREIEREHDVEVQEAEYAERVRMAEKEMAAAARRLAELSSQRLPEIREMQMKFVESGRPRIGITIEGDDESGPVEGVEVTGVTPGTAADDAGLRAGDIITAVNGEPMTADSSTAANKLLFDFMDGVEEGDELLVDYIRNGNQGTVELSPRNVDMQAYAWAPGNSEVFVERFVKPHKAPGNFRFDFRFPWGSAWGSMELVELNEGLGKYFGTEKGLLVVSAPQPDNFGLEDGDVIQSIDGREPKDIRHALKILGSYDSGETLELGIMRDKRARTLEVEIPANDYRGMRLGAPLAPKPVRAPIPPQAAPVEGST